MQTCVSERSLPGNIPRAPIHAPICTTARQCSVESADAPSHSCAFKAPFCSAWRCSNNARKTLHTVGRKYESTLPGNCPPPNWPWCCTGPALKHALTSKLRSGSWLKRVATCALLRNETLPGLRVSTCAHCSTHCRSCSYTLNKLNRAHVIF